MAKDLDSSNGLGMLVRRYAVIHNRVDQWSDIKDTIRGIMGKHPKHGHLSLDQIAKLFDESYGLGQEALLRLESESKVKPALEIPELYQIPAVVDLDASSSRRLIKYLRGDESEVPVQTDHNVSLYHRAAGCLLDFRRLARKEGRHSPLGKRAWRVAALALSVVQKSPKSKSRVGINKGGRVMAKKKTGPKTSGFVTRRNEGVGDDVAIKLKKLETVPDMIAYAEKLGLDDMKKYKHSKNPGLARMAIGNRIRGFMARKDRAKAEKGNKKKGTGPKKAGKKTGPKKKKTGPKRK